MEVRYPWIFRGQRTIEEDDRGFPFVLDPPLAEKNRKAKKMRETTSAFERRILAARLPSALTVPEPDCVRGLRIMVYDDVFTGGNTLNAVAKKLKAAGATEVHGLVSWS
ncbi:phosphoribosyltransferase [Actinocorallia aurantiaca]|uniref:Phosphoribosyl transferase-like protein n=1 Tax=Actinocorallia aurantiaca TaxID=46204 RepID=A0ABN3UJ09_9ACTN